MLSDTYLSHFLFVHQYRQTDVLLDRQNWGSVSNWRSSSPIFKILIGEIGGLFQIKVLKVHFLILFFKGMTKKIHILNTLCPLVRTDGRLDRRIRGVFSNYDSNSPNFKKKKKKMLEEYDSRDLSFVFWLFVLWKSFWVFHTTGK